MYNGIMWLRMALISHDIKSFISVFKMQSCTKMKKIAQNNEMFNLYSMLFY